MLDKTIIAFVVFMGLLVLTGCDFNPLEIFDELRTYKVSDLTGEYKATTPDGEEILIFYPDMTFLQKYTPKNDDKTRENKGTWRIRDKRIIDFSHILFFVRDFAEKGDAIQHSGLIGMAIKRSKGKIMLEWGQFPPDVYRWIKYK